MRGVKVDSMRNGVAPGILPVNAHGFQFIMGWEPVYWTQAQCFIQAITILTAIQSCTIPWIRKSKILRSIITFTSVPSITTVLPRNCCRHWGKEEVNTICNDDRIVNSYQGRYYYHWKSCTYKKNKNRIIKYFFRADTIIIYY